jgi:monovalent cation:H+ antiporter-2, CPA2 family
MPHQTTLIATFVSGIVLAFVFGAIARRLKLSPLVGYLLAGIAVGPFTPGFVADQDLAPVLAEVGVILLMFGVGLHFSLSDLLAVRRIAVPGALVQILVATGLGAALGLVMGWPLASGLIFGLSLSVASTVVLLRALEEHRLVNTERGRIAVGWLIVEDLVMVLVLVLVPAIAGVTADSNASSLSEIAIAVLETIGKVAAFVAVMLVVGRRVIPWLLKQMVISGSRELFTLSVLSIALGVAFGSASLFGVSFALGAFFAGMVLNESEFSHEAAADSLPLRDAFSVLFFVSVGMLFDPSILIREPIQVLATLMIIVVGKSIAAYAIVRSLGHSTLTASTVAMSLAQIGEFSFILAALGVDMALMTESVRDLVLAGALLSIVLNPFFFVIMARIERRRERISGAKFSSEHFKDHVILVGFGRVGSMVGAKLMASGRLVVVLEAQDDPADAAGDAGLPVLVGDASLPAMLELAGIHQASHLLVTIPNAVVAGKVIAVAKTLKPGINTVVSAYSVPEEEYLLKRRADKVIVGGREISNSMAAAAMASTPLAMAGELADR